MSDLPIWQVDTISAIPPGQSASLSLVPQATKSAICSLGFRGRLAGFCCLSHHLGGCFCKKTWGVRAFQQAEQGPVGISTFTFWRLTEARRPG